MRTSGFPPRSVYIYEVAKSYGFCILEKQRKTQNHKIMLCG